MKIQKPGRAAGVARTLEEHQYQPSALKSLHGVDLPAEDQCQRKQKLGDITSCFSRLNASNDHVRKRRSEQQEGPDK